MATWKGAAQYVLAAPVEKVWEVSSDFGGVSKLFPAAANVTSEITEGEPQAVGCVRTVVGSLGAADERLLEINHKEHFMKYVIEKNSLQLEGLVGTFKLSPHGDNGTLAEWSCEMPPWDGRREEEFVTLMVPMYNQLLKRLDDLVQTAPK